MPIGQDFIVDLTRTNDRRQLSVTAPSGSHFSATAMVEMCLAGPRALARIMSMRSGRARLDRMPDHLLHDIGIDRSEIGSIIRHQGKDDTRRRQD